MIVDQDQCERVTQERDFENFGGPGFCRVERSYRADVKACWQEQVKLLKKEIYQYDILKYWHFIYANETEITKVFNSLSSKQDLNVNLSTNNVFIIDTELNQRGRLDDRTDREKEKNAPVYELNSYNCIQIAEIKNKMSEDLRILFTEYRQKRKGNFDSASRREEEIKPKDEQN